MTDNAPESQKDNVRIPKLIRLNLSARSIKEMTEWSRPMIDDYSRIAAFCEEVSFFLNSRGQKFWETTSG